MKKIAIFIIFLISYVTCFSQVTATASVSATIVTPIVVNQKEDKEKELVFEFNECFYYDPLVKSDTISTITADRNRLYIKKEKNQTIIINYN